MALIVADTDVLIDYLAEREEIVERVVAFSSAQRLTTTAISVFELLSGASEGRKGKGARDLVELLEVLNLDRASATTAAKIRRELDAGGRSIGMADSLIAGVCLQHGAILFTRNRRLFERVSGLQVI